MMRDDDLYRCARPGNPGGWVASPTLEGRRAGARQPTGSKKMPDHPGIHSTRLNSYGLWAARANTIGLLAFCLFVHVTSSFAQYSLRSPYVPSPYANFRPYENATFLRLGPIGGSLSAGLGTDYTDNYFLTETNKISAFEVYQLLNLDLTWVLTPRNRIDLNLGGKLSEVFPSSGHILFLPAFSPESSAQFQFAVSNFRFKVFNRFAYIQDPVADPGISNTSNLNEFNNTGGVSVDWLLHQATVNLTFDDTYDYAAPGGTTSSTTSPTGGTRNTIRGSSALALNYSPTIVYGMEATAAHSVSPGNPDANAVDLGPFARGQLTRLFDIDLHAGVYFVRAPNTNPVNYYISITLRDQINRQLQAYLSFIRDLEFSTASNLAENNFCSLNAEYLLAKNLRLSGGAFVNFGTLATGPNSGNYTQFGVQAGPDLTLGKRLTASFRYRLVRQSSDVAGNGYTQNLISCQLTYAF
jgi:hypothetical protein